MSVAFTRESDIEAAATDLADRPVSSHPNLVTPEGLAAIDRELAAASAAHAAALGADGLATDRTALARATRDKRYWSARRASAQLIEPGEGDAARFGSTITFERPDGRSQTYRIVGEDEADPAAGTVSHVSPLARALYGKRVADVAMLAGEEIVLIAIT